MKFKLDTKFNRILFNCYTKVHYAYKIYYKIEQNINMYEI